MFGRLFGRRLPSRTDLTSGASSIAYVLASLGAVGIASQHIGQAIVVQGASMMPTIRPCCAVVWCNAWSLRRHPVRVGDVVAARVQDGKTEHGSSAVVKRVAGVAGDVIYDPDTGLATRVPADHVWLLGDNLRESRDSRVYGPVPVSSLRARVTHQIFPRFQRIPALPASPSSWIILAPQ